jgi:hypothetical protein
MSETKRIEKFGSVADVWEETFSVRGERGEGKRAKRKPPRDPERGLRENGDKKKKKNEQGKQSQDEIETEGTPKAEIAQSKAGSETPAVETTSLSVDEINDLLVEAQDVPEEVLDSSLEPRKEAKEKAEKKVEKISVEDAEKALFFSREREVVDRIVEKYTESAEIEEGTKKEIIGILAKDIEDCYREFALDWFCRAENQRRIEQDGKIIPPEASDEWKINMALSSKEKGGMNAVEELKDEKYREYRKKIRQAEILSSDFKRDKLLPETPFLALNYLQKKFVQERTDLNRLEQMAQEGNRASAIEVDPKRKDVEKLDLLRKELAEKVTGQNLRQIAENKVEQEITGKKEWVDKESRILSAEKFDASSLELAERELKAYDRLPEKEKAKYRKKLNLGNIQIDVLREDFVKSIVGKEYNPQQVERAYQEQRVKVFKGAIIELSNRNGITDAAVWGLLKNGFRPYEPVKWAFWGDGILLPTIDGNTKKIKPAESKGKNMFVELLNSQKSISAEYDNFIEKITNDYKGEINFSVKSELETEWQKQYEELVNYEIDKSIKLTANSPENAEDGIDAIYEKARQRIIQEYIDTKKTEQEIEAEKNEHAELEEKIAKLKEDAEKREKEGKEEKRLKIEKIMQALDVLSSEGLEEFDGRDQENISDLLEGFGVNKAKELVHNVSKEDYQRITNKGKFLFRFLVHILRINQPKKERKK